MKSHKRIDEGLDDLVYAIGKTPNSHPLCVPGIAYIQWQREKRRVENQAVFNKTCPDVRAVEPRTFPD